MLKKYVLRCLARRSYSSFELRKLLQEKGALQKDIDKILLEMQELGYLNDLCWVEHFITAQLAKKTGPRMIAMKLQAKGIPESFFSSLLSCLGGFEVQKEQIERLLKTRYRHISLEDFKDKQKVMAALARKGFSFEVIRGVLDCNGS